MLRTERMKTNGKNGKMKLTKSKLKQLIREAFEDEEDFLETVPEAEEEGEEEGEESALAITPPGKREGEDLGGETIDTVDEFMKTAEAFYDRLSEDQKWALTHAFEDAFDKWEEDLLQRKGESFMGKTWVTDLEALMLDIWKDRCVEGAGSKGNEYADCSERVVELYNKLPEEGKPYLIKNLEMYAEKFPEREEYAQYLSVLEQN